VRPAWLERDLVWIGRGSIWLIHRARVQAVSPFSARAVRAASNPTERAAPFMESMRRLGPRLPKVFDVAMETSLAPGILIPVPAPIARTDSWRAHAEAAFGSALEARDRPRHWLVSMDRFPHQGHVLAFGVERPIHDALCAGAKSVGVRVSVIRPAFSFAWDRLRRSLRNGERVVFRQEASTVVCTVERDVPRNWVDLPHANEHGGPEPDPTCLMAVAGIDAPSPGGEAWISLTGNARDASRPANARIRALALFDAAPSMSTTTSRRQDDAQA